MTKITIALFILGFWLFFPVAVILMNSNNYFVYDTTTISDFAETSTNTNPELKESSSIGDFFSAIWNFINVIWSFVKIYISAMYMIIPNSEGVLWGILPIIILFLQLVSGLVVYLLLREG